jgi:hypothetical protein
VLNAANEQGNLVAVGRVEGTGDEFKKQTLGLVNADGV